jgi:polysaccharide export outer membrane protein
MYSVLIIRGMMGFLIRLVPTFALSIVVSSLATSTKAGTSIEYLLTTGDILRIQVFQEPDLDREVRVSHDGSVTLPLIGKVTAAGLNTETLETEISKKYGDGILVSPQITVNVIKYKSRVVNVLGSLNAPQAIEYPAGEKMTLLEILSRAGGFNRLADRRKVRITRSLPSGKSSTQVIDVENLLSSTDTTTIYLEPDDIVFVPERVL